jgi:hypothetical protein
MLSKFRNNTTNIGIYCGFARAEGHGQIRVQQTSSRDMGLVFDLAAGAREPTQDFEPVTVIYQAEPGKPGERPTFTALYVTRLARSHLPKGFVWRSGAWPNDPSFYPFSPEKAGPLNAELDALIADEHEWPQWLLDAAEHDSELADLLTQGGSRSRLSNRLVVTGRIITDSESPVHEGSKYQHLNLLLRQPGDVDAFEVRYGEHKPGYNRLAHRSYPNGGMAVTAVLKPEVRVFEHDGTAATHSEFSIRMLEMMIVTDADIAPGASVREVMAA